MMSLVKSCASGHALFRNSNEVISGTLGNGWALCGAGENETDKIFFAFVEASLGGSAGDNSGEVGRTSAVAELERLSCDPGFWDADIMVDFQEF